MNKCKILGHDVPSEIETCFTGFQVVCKRCGQDKETIEYDADMVEWHGFGIFTLPAKWLWQLNWLPSSIKYRISVWWNPCPNCGLRFGQHDSNVQHIPF